MTREALGRLASIVATVILLLALCAGAQPPAAAQISHGGTPYSFTNEVGARVHTVTLQPLDRDSLLAAEQEELQEPGPHPFRYGVPRKIDLGMENAGTWEDLGAAGRMWRLKIWSVGAFSLDLVYSDFHMPDGGRFFVYNPERTTVLGSFTADNNKPWGGFRTSAVEGDMIVLEYNESRRAAEEPLITVERVIHAYKDVSFPDEPEIPDLYTHHGNSPNPFLGSTDVRFELPETSHVRLVVYDILGRVVEEVVDRQMGPCFCKVTWEASDASSGVYLYRLTADDNQWSGQMVRQ